MNKGRTIAEATRGSLPWREKHLQKSLDFIKTRMGELFPGVNLDRMQQVFDNRRTLLRRLEEVRQLQEQQAAQSDLPKFREPFRAEYAEFLNEVHEQRLPSNQLDLRIGNRGVP